MFWVFAFCALAAIVLAAHLIGLNRRENRKRRSADDPPLTRERAMHMANVAEVFPHTKED